MSITRREIWIKMTILPLHAMDKLYVVAKQKINGFAQQQQKLDENGTWIIKSHNYYGW